MTPRHAAPRPDSAAASPLHSLVLRAVSARERARCPRGPSAHQWRTPRRAQALEEIRKFKNQKKQDEKSLGLELATLEERLGNANKLREEQAKPPPGCSPPVCSLLFACLAP